MGSKVLLTAWLLFSLFFFFSSQEQRNPSHTDLCNPSRMDILRTLTTAISSPTWAKSSMQVSFLHPQVNKHTSNRHWSKLGRPGRSVHEYIQPECAFHAPREPEPFLQIPGLPHHAALLREHPLDGVRHAHHSLTQPGADFGLCL